MRDGAVVGVRGVAIDISERKLARERERERTHTIETLNRIMAEGNRAASVASFAKNVTNLTLELLRFDAGTIHLTDDGARCAKMRYATGIPDSAAEAIREIPFDKTPYAAVLSEGGPLFVDGQEASRVPHVTELGLKSLAVVPLHRHDETIGALSVGTFKLHIFSQAEKELLTAIGNEVGTVIAKLHTEESLKRHAQMVDLAKDGIIIRNLNDRITYWNKGAERLYGWSAAEAEGQKIYALLQTAHARPWADIKRELCAGGGWKGEFTCTAKNGRLLIVDSRQTLYTDATGEPAAIFEINTDITGRKQAEELLRASERHIRELTSALPVVVYEADTSGRATFVNATLYDMFGYTKEEFEAGMSIYGLVTDADRERARTVSLRRMDRKNVGRAEYTGLRKDGSTFPVAAIGAPITRDGAVVGVRGVIIDSTDEKLAEERVQEHMHTIEMLNRIMTEGNRAASVESFAETLTTLTLELTHFDAGTIHIFDNDARHSNLIYATGIPDPTVAAIRQVPLDETAYAALLDEGAPIFVDGEAVRRVPHVAELGLKSVAVVELHRLDEIVGTFSVGSLKRHIFSQAEKELLTAIGNEAGVVIAKLQADAVIKESLKEREIILNEIHHRVKNNMQIISSLLSLQAAQATEPETVEMLNASQGRIRSMALIHEQLYSSGSLAKIDFARYVESLIAHLQGTFDVDPDAVTITVDVKDTYLGVDTAVPCALIVNELVTNCLKHAFPGATRGTVSVVTHPTNAWTYELIVADTGVGFPRDLDFRATASLGMQLVNALVGQLDGMITLDRTKGTAFNISFKRSPADTGAKPRG